MRRRLLLAAIVAISVCQTMSGCSKKEKDIPVLQVEVSKTKEPAPTPIAMVAEAPAPAPTDALPSRDGADNWYYDWEILANTRDPQTIPPKQHPHRWFQGELDPGYNNRPYFEGKGKRTGLLILHPLSQNEPAKIGFKGVVPSDKPMLVVEASGSVHGDCILRCVVNNSPVGEYVIDGKKWTQCEFDLTPHLGKPINIEIWNVAGGAKPWQFETCYIDRIYFDRSSASPAQARAIAIIKQLGGKYQEDPNVLGNPIIRVNLAGTKTNDRGLLQLKGLKDVEAIDLNGCFEVGDAGLAALADMKNLKNVMLWGCHKITDAGFAHLEGLSNLEWLNIGYTGVDKITGSGLVHLKGLHKLRSLGLNSLHKLNNASLVSIKDMRGLEDLGLGYTSVTDDGLRYLTGLKNLKQLNLEGDKITDAGLATIGTLTQLKTVNLRATKLSDIAVMDLQKKIPGLKIIR